MTAALKHLGNYIENPAFAEFQQISVESLALFHSQTSKTSLKKPLDELIVRMMYVAETTSVALRLTASWALTLPTFSLCRDRYEQTVRFSWLARQPSNDGWTAYLADFIHTKHRFKTSFRERGIDPLTNLDTKLDGASKNTRDEYAKWKRTSVDQLARQRDLRPGITGTKIDSETLELFYESIYRQGSSVSHYDMWSINMLSIHEKFEKLILAPDPYLPIVLVLHSALFDLIICSEAAAKLNCLDDAEPWDALLERWRVGVKRTGLLD